MTLLLIIHSTAPVNIHSRIHSSPAPANNLRLSPYRQAKYGYIPLDRLEVGGGAAVGDDCETMGRDWWEKAAASRPQ